MNYDQLDKLVFKQLPQHNLGVSKQRISLLPSLNSPFSQIMSCWETDVDAVGLYLAMPLRNCCMPSQDGGCTAYSDTLTTLLPLIKASHGLESSLRQDKSINRVYTTCVSEKD